MTRHDSWADSLPRPADRRAAVRVTPDALRQLRGGSPWLYDGSITSVSHEPATGDLAVVFDGDRRFAGIGLWDATSPIRLKLVHVGSPVPIDSDFWGFRIDAARQRRSGFENDRATNGYRVVHGENDQLPGLVVDRYDTTLVIKLYTPAWFAHLSELVTVLIGAFHPRRVVVRLARSVAAGETYGLADGQTLVGDPPTSPVLFRERGLVMEADVVRGQKTGYFLDQRDNRALVRSLAAGRDVLDVFSSNGGFAVSALAGGAESVHVVDQSAHALASAHRNIDRNRRVGDGGRGTVAGTEGDAFAVLGEMANRRQQFGLVIVDPPSFASNRAAVPRALAAYARLTRLALGVVKPGGMLVQASCSSRVDGDSFVETVLAAAASARRDAHVVRRTGHPVDHPVGFEFGEYLKAVYLNV